MMRTSFLYGLALLGSATATFAAAPAGAPAGTTATCKDGSYWTGDTKSGACSKHKGVQAWYGPAAAPAKDAKPAKTTAAATPAPAPAPAPVAPAPAAKPTVAAAPVAPVAPAKPAATTPPQPAANAAPGGGPGLVWANETTKVYHCSGDRWYGKTKHGAYLSEADAKAKGYKGDHGKTCG